MFTALNFIREISFIGVFLRLLCAVLCGGVIGFEREYKRRPAGLRTHILICLGAAMTTLTSQYLYLTMHLYTDIARLGAQVIAGIGFIGAGTIIVTKQRRIKGLTTAAGLWTAAIIGLVCGAGYVECAIFATAMVMFAELVLIKIEYKFARQVRNENMYIEYYHSDTVEKIIHILRDDKIKISNLEITRLKADEDGKGSKYCAIFTVQAGEEHIKDVFQKKIAALDTIIAIEQL